MSMDWPRFRQGPPEIMAPLQHFTGVAIQNLITAKDGSNLIAFRALQGCVCKWRPKYGILIRYYDWEDGIRANRWIGRDLGWIIQKSRPAVRRFTGPTIRALITAKDGPNLINVQSLQLRFCVNGDSNMVFLALIRIAKWVVWRSD